MRNRLIYTLIFGMLSALALVAAACSAVPSASVQNTAAPTAVSASAPATATPASSAAPADISGNTVRLVIVPSQSTAGYRVREQLAGLSFPTDAGGTTNAITGTIVGKTDGTILSDQSKFQVDLRTLKSDQSMRDNFIQRNPLQTDQYPYATFVPTSAPGLPLTLPASGQVAFKLIGNLTIRDVTKPVTWDVTGTVKGNTATLQATTTFKFEDFDLTPPHVGRVLNIVDSIRLELNVTLQRE